MVQGSNHNGGDIFHTHPDYPWGPIQPPVWWVPGLFSGVKRPGHGIDHPLPTNAKVNERVEIYFYPPSGPSCQVIGWTSPYFEESVWDYGLDTTFSDYASVVGCYEHNSEIMACRESMKLSC